MPRQRGVEPTGCGLQAAEGWGIQHDGVAGAANRGGRDRDRPAGEDVGPLHPAAEASVAVAEATGQGQGHGPTASVDPAQLQFAAMAGGDRHRVVGPQHAAVTHAHACAACHEADGLGGDQRIEVAVSQGPQGHGRGDVNPVTTAGGDGDALNALDITKDLHLVEAIGAGDREATEIEFSGCLEAIDG